MFQIDRKKFFLLKKLKIHCHGHILLVNLIVKKLLEYLQKVRKELQKSNPKGFRVEIVLSCVISCEKLINCMSNGKATILVTSWFPI